MILTYAKPEDEEEYANEGGEDWGWFVNDVGQYFADHHPEIEMVMYTEVDYCLKKLKTSWS